MPVRKLGGGFVRQAGGRAFLDCYDELREWVSFSLSLPGFLGVWSFLRRPKMEAAAAKLLDFSQPMDVALLDQVVTTAFDASHPQV